MSKRRRGKRRQHRRFRQPKSEAQLRSEAAAYSPVRPARRARRRVVNEWLTPGQREMVDDAMSRMR